MKRPPESHRPSEEPLGVLRVLPGEPFEVAGYGGRRLAQLDQLPVFSANDISGV